MAVSRKKPKTKTKAKAKTKVKTKRARKAPSKSSRVKIPLGEVLPKITKSSFEKDRCWLLEIIKVWCRTAASNGEASKTISLKDLKDFYISIDKEMWDNHIEYVVSELKKEKLAIMRIHSIFGNLKREIKISWDFYRER